MIRAFIHSIGTLVVAALFAASLVVTAVVVVLGGCYLALWPPKPQSLSRRLLLTLLDRIRRDGGY